MTYHRVRKFFYAPMKSKKPKPKEPQRDSRHQALHPGAGQPRPTAVPDLGRRIDRFFSSGDLSWGLARAGCPMICSRARLTGDTIATAVTERDSQPNML